MTNTSKLPEQFKKDNLFCVWKYEERGGKKTKVPYNPKTGARAQSNNPHTFSTLTEAEQVQGKYDGIGVGIFGELCAVDIDHCIQNGEIHPLASGIIALMKSYTEISPSGEGIRILFKAKGVKPDKAKYYINNQKAGLEIYLAGHTNKYVTVTGNAIGDYHEVEERENELLAVLEAYMQRPSKEKSKSVQTASKINPHSASVDYKPATLSDDEVIYKAHHAKNGDVFAKLWNGDSSAYKSESEADLALCNLLAFWTSKNPAQMDNLFRVSGLYREKWDRPQSGSTYGAITIENAIAGTKESYADRKRSELRGAIGNIKSTDSVRPADFSEVGQSQLFARVYKNQALFCSSMGWLVWNGSKWEADEQKANCLVMNITDEQLKECVGELKTSGELLDKALLNEDELQISKAKSKQKQAREYLKFVNTMRKGGAIASVLRLSASLLNIKPEMLDSDPYILNTPKGMINLKTGELTPPDPYKYCTKSTQYSPSDKGAELWNEFLDKISGGNIEMVEFLKQVAGMCAVGRVYMENLIIAIGDGGNGKSTFFNTLLAVMNDYGGTIDAEILTTRGKNRGAELANLKGKRVVVAAELEEGARLSSSVLKQIASTDPIHAERKYKDPEDFIPSHSTILYTNHAPKVGSTDSGTWRRLIMLPFPEKLTKNGEIKNYASYLSENAGEAIAQWIVEGASEYIANNHALNIPQFVLEANNEYKQENDWLGDFIDECCDIGVNYRVMATDLYDKYRRNSERIGEYTRSKKDFGDELEKVGYTRKRQGRGIVWRGLKINQNDVYSAYNSV